MRTPLSCLGLLTLLMLSLGARSNASDEPKSNYLLFVGTYTEKESKGIYAYHLDTASGQLISLGLAAETTNPFEIDPSGSRLFVANQGSGNIVIFRIDPRTGQLTSTGQVLNVLSPVCLKFVAIE